MSIAMHANRTFTVYRTTARLLVAQNASGAGANIPAYAGAGAALILVEFDAPVSATVVVTGMVGTVPTVETLTFTASKRETTWARFSSVSNITASIATPLTATMVGSGGEPITRNIVVQAGLWARLDRSSSTWFNAASGAVERDMGTPILLFDNVYDYQPQTGDLAVDDGTGKIYRMSPTVDEMGLYRPHHHEVPVQMADDAHVDIYTPPG